MSIFGSTKDDRDRERWTKLRPIVDLGLQQFQRTGKALREIRDAQLYRFEFKTWDDCCRTAWKITARHADRLIDAATVVEELEPTGAVPANEHQARQILSVPPAERQAAWSEALAEGATPAAIERAVAKRRGPKSKKTAALKPLRLKVPGGSVVIIPNRKSRGHEQLLVDALHVFRTKAAA